MNLRLTVAYDGSAYAGFQIQPSAPTIQGKLEEGLGRFLDLRGRVVGAGRTDAGVHALGQVVSVKVKRVSIPPANVARAARRYLPPDIVIRHCEEAPGGFSARYDAMGKTYAYALLARRRPSVYWRTRAFQLTWDLDFDAMCQAARMLTGNHDYTNFAVGLDGDERTLRTVDSISFKKWGPYHLLVFRGRGFLRGMVRMLTGAILDVGRGFVGLDRIEALLDGTCIEKLQNAPAHGLYLVGVRY